MAELTIEQKRALALARARVRVQQQAQARPAPAPKKPEETGFLRDLADVAIPVGQSIINLVKPLAYLQQRISPSSLAPAIGGAALEKYEELLKGARSEADIQREQARQRKIAEEVKAPGAVARGLAEARQFIEGPKRPAEAETPLSGIADFLSPSRAIASLLPETPEAAQREVSGVTSQFASPIEAAQFFASQAPATGATILAGGVRKAGALAQGLDRFAAAKLGQQAAVRTGAALNATDAGYSAAQDVLAKGGTQEEADRAFVVASGGAALASAAAAKIPGVEQNLFSTKALAPGIIRGAARSAAGEAPQEFIEEAGAQLSQNIAKLGTAAETPISEGVLSSGALGVIGGAGFGAGTGAVQGFLERGEAAAPPPPPPAAGAEPIRTATVTYPNREDPTNPITRTIDQLTQPDEAGYITVRDDTGRTFEMKEADLDELEAASSAYQAAPETEAPAPTPTVDRATITERMRVASGTPEGAKPAGRVVSLANDVASALEAGDPVSAQNVIQSRMNALAASRMSEATKAQRQAEIDEAQSIVNDYRVEFARARAAAPARIEAPAVEPSSIEQALEQNRALAEQEAADEAARADAERARLERESALESASLVGQASPIRQAQTERQQLFDTIINDDTIENPAGAFRQALRDRGYPSVELTEAERRQVQARRAFTKPAAIVPFTGEEIAPEIIKPTPVAAEPVEGEFTEVPAPLPAAPPEVVAGAAAPAPSRRAQLMAGAAIEPGVPAVAFGEEPKPSAMNIGLLGEPMTQQEMDDYDARKKAREDAREKLREVLKGFGFTDITVIVRDLLEGGKFAGSYDPMDSIIRIAMNPDGTVMESVLYHELVHYLKDHGFFTDAEWNAILKFAKRDLIMRGILEYAYRGETRANKDEEIVAEGFRNWMSESAEGFQKKNNIFAKMRRFLNAIRDFFFSQNLNDANAVFEAIRNGEFATREDKGSAKRAEYYAGTAEKPGRRPIYAGRSITRSRALGGAVEAKIIRQNLEAAEQMEAAGAGSDEIRIATGWERNPYDNEWRYIQADDMASATPILEDFVRDYDSASDAYLMTLNGDGSFDLGDLMRHSELYSIYPDARSIHVFLKKSGGGELQGSFDPSDKSIDLYADARDPLDTLLHEVQHWVQEKEGFAFGSSPSTVWDALTDEQKRIEAETGIDVLNGDLDDLSQALDVMAYLNSDPDFRAAVEDGTAMQELEDFFGRAFEDGVIVDDRIYGLVRERLEDIVNERQALGLADPSLVTEDLLNELNSISEEVDQKTRLIEDIKDGDPTEEGSPAEEAARTAFEDHTRRNVIRYIDTAGEIEARDVSAQRRKSKEELLGKGMLQSEKAPRPGAVVISRRAKGEAGSVSPNPTTPPNTTKGAKLGFIAGIRSTLSDIYRKLAYKYSGAVKLDEQLANALGVDKLPKDMSLEDRMSMFETMKTGLLRDFDRMWFAPFKRALKASGIDPQDLAMYLWARSAADRNAMIAERNRDMPDGGSGLTNLEAEGVLAFYKASGMMRQMEPLVKMHDQLVDWMLKQRVKSGLMSKEEADLLRKQQPFYTPLKGFAAEGDMTTAGDEDPHVDYKGIAQRGVRPQDYIKAEGRTSMPFDPMSNLIADAMQLTQRIARNDVGKRFLSIVRDFPDLLGSTVKIYTDDKPKIVKKGIAAPGSKKKTVGPMNMAANAKKFLVVKENGKNFYIEIDEKTEDGAMLKRMFDNMSPQQLEGAVKWLAAAGRFRKQMLTRFNPIFWAMNFGRDLQDMLVTAYSESSRVGSPVEGKKVALRALKNMASPSTWMSVGRYISGRDPVKADQVENVLLLSQMVQDGGEAGYSEMMDAQAVAKRINADLDVIKKGGVKGIWDKAENKRRALANIVDSIQEFLSLWLRFSAYKAAIDEGTKPDDAAKFALDSTLNLGRKGEATQAVDNIWIFTNPAIQSLEKKKRIYSSKGGRKAMALMMGVGVALHFWNMANAGDEDDDGENDYQDLDEGTKMTNLIIYPYGGGEPVKIPVGFMVGFEVYLGQQVARMVTNDGSGIGVMRAASNALSAFVATQLPAGEKVGQITDVPKLAVPDIFVPLVDLWRNKNFFGGDIYPTPYYEGQAVSGMARKSTGEFYKKFAEGLNRLGGGTEDVASSMDTPAEAWKYLVDQYLLLGGAALPKDIAKFFEEGAPADLTKVPVAKRFVGDNSEYAAQNKYFDRAKKVEVIAGQYEGENEDEDAYAESEKKFPVESDPDVIEAFKEANKELRKLSKEAREIRNEGGPNMNADLEEIEAERKQVYVDFNEEYNRVKQGR